MRISEINNYNNTPNFGHSFRVSICMKDAKGAIRFINPSEENKLYKNLNSKIVNWLNEDYYTNLRNLFGKGRKIQKTKPQTDVHKQMISKLREIDDDYRRFNVVRSIYRRNNLGYIATGVDVPIIENLKGAKQIGIAKADSVWNYGDAHTAYVKALSKAVKNNSLDYVKHDNILLHSPRNKEVMLRAIFTESGKNKAGKPFYELDSFEFHENATKRTLAPVNPNFIRFKNSYGMMEEIKRTIQYHVNKITKRKVHFNDINEILNPKIEEAPVKVAAQEATKTIKKSPKPKQQTLQTKKPVQLEFDFKD